MCRRFGCLPSALLAEDGNLLRLLEMEALGADTGAMEGEGAGRDEW